MLGFLGGIWDVVVESWCWVRYQLKADRQQITGTFSLKRNQSGMVVIRKEGRYEDMRTGYLIYPGAVIHGHSPRSKGKHEVKAFHFLPKTRQGACL
jgi:hypothetical protein